MSLYCRVRRRDTSDVCTVASITGDKMRQWTKHLSVALGDHVYIALTGGGTHDADATRSY